VNLDILFEMMIVRKFKPAAEELAISRHSACPPRGRPSAPLRMSTGSMTLTDPSRTWHCLPRTDHRRNGLRRRLLGLPAWLWLLGGVREAGWRRRLPAEDSAAFCQGCTCCHQAEALLPPRGL